MKDSSNLSYKGKNEKIFQKASDINQNYLLYTNQAAKILPTQSPLLYLKFGKLKNGGQSNQEIYRVRELRVDSKGWLYAKYYLNECSELFFQFVIIGKCV